MFPSALLLFLAGALGTIQPGDPDAAAKAIPTSGNPAPFITKSDPGAESRFRLERAPVAGGAELITLFGREQDLVSGTASRDVPLVSVLRDTLGSGDPENYRLRYVWILTGTRPTPFQRLASGLSFFCFRAGGRRHDNRIPSPVLDLASPAKSVWPNLVANSLQASQFDPLGVAVRASTRSYRANSSDYRKMLLFQGLSALDGAERSGTPANILSASERREIYSRLSLANRTFGGLVRRKNLSKVYEEEISRQEQTRGHNWELLRQRAELAGLYFEPLALPGQTPSQALVWVAAEDLTRPAHPRFDRQFLNIADPWTDGRLAHWTGYSKVRYQDAEHRLAPAETAGARPVVMIPLALYSLDYPRVPLLLVDFRDSLKPKRGELVRHGASTVLTGVFGITRFGSWPFFMGDSAWTFVRERHGAAVDRSARLRAYAETREFLALDAQLDPRLKGELVGRLDHLALNPLESGISTEATLARDQYAALLRSASSPNGLAAKLDRDRRKELNAYTHSRARRLLAAIGRVLIGGPRLDPQESGAQVRIELAAYRSASHYMQFLEQVLASSPRPEVVWNPDNIRQAVEALSSASKSNPRAARLIAQVFSHSDDSEIRFACLRSLRQLDIEEAHNELWRLSQDPGTADSWRAICLLYFNGDTLAVPTAATGGAQ